MSDEEALWMAIDIDKLVAEKRCSIGTNSSSKITEEQRQRIVLHKQAAMEKRAKRG